MNSKKFKKDLLKFIVLLCLIILVCSEEKLDSEDDYQQFLADENTTASTTSTTITVKANANAQVETNSTESSGSTEKTKQGFGIKCFWFYDDNQTFDLSPLERGEKEE